MPRILIIDDDPAMCSLLARALERSGHQTFTASDGGDGLRLAAAEPPDLVICDIVMPDTEGIETILALRRARPDVGIIAVSGGGLVSPSTYLALASAAGATRVFEKPFDLSALLSAVDELVGPATNRAR
jgi:DNA-binding response OmpR family regulator